MIYGDNLDIYSYTIFKKMIRKHIDISITPWIPRIIIRQFTISSDTDSFSFNMFYPFPLFA